MNLSLHNKTALICGSTGGIGLAAAQELSLLGANCLLMARNQASLQHAIGLLDKSNGQKHQFAVADFTQPDAVLAALAPFLEKTAVHILINNTGGPAAGAITDATTQSFEDAFKQHVVINQLLAQAVLPGMKKEVYGRIINVVSTSVKIPLPNLGVSNTIRAAVAGWAKTWANEIAFLGITVNNVLPGFTDTARLKSLIKHTAGTQQQTEESVTAAMQNSVPAKRFGTAAEVAALIAFLATPAAAYINGTSIPADGGRTGSI